ncbi:S-layer homology domain-containing protein [Cohnella hongkongensis]|uniref:S-layer homology domain-containing protein n=1 Tax=Cohnella hongkongensis TaxID=178337 RepID=A0ABV9FG24_9BACL
MKKSLSILLSFALVFGLFASMASAADTELTAAQKYQALVDKGVLKGNPDGDPRLDNNLNRAEYATLAIAIAGLAEEKPATATFSDVNSKQWWYGAIEAAAKAGLVEGFNGKFNPRDNVTVEQVIKVAVQAAGLELVADAEVEGASAWAGPYIQAALDAGLIPAGLNYTADATRGQTFVVGYAVYEKLNPTEPAKVSVAKAEATGVKQVTVTLDKAVDTEKAKFALKKGTVNVVLDKVTWSEDGKVATLPLKDVKVTEGEYTVTLSGLEEGTVEKDSASFTAQNETVKSIDFVTSVAEIAYTARAKVKVAAKNQYDELASFPASYYTVFTGYNGLNERITKNDAGELVVILDTNVAGIQQNSSQIPLTIYFNETRIQAQKTFKVGNAPFVTKMELGAVKYDGTKTSLSNSGEVATVPVNLYDQYGNPITKDQMSTAINFNQFITPQPNKLTASVDDFNNDDEYEVKVTLTGKEAKSSTYTLTVYAGGTSATQTINVGNAKLATKVAFGEFGKDIAEGDNDTYYVPVIAYDVDGNQLTKDELVDAANLARIKVTVSNDSAVNSLVATGPNKGSIPVKAGSLAAKQVIFVSASIAEIDAQDYKTTSITIKDKRLPETLVITGRSATKAVLGAGSDFTIKIRDQYGSDIDVPTDYSVVVSFVDLTGSSGIVLKGRDGNTLDIAAGTPNAPATATYETGDKFNDGFKFETTAGVFGKVQFKAELFKNSTSLRVVTQEIESIDPTKVDLTYSLKDLGSIYAIRDTNYSYKTESVTDSNLKKKVQVAVKDSAGNDVAFPDDKVASVTVSNGQVVAVGATGSVGAAVYYVLGNKAGDSSVNATVYSAKGEIVHATGAVTVKSDLVTVETLSAGNGDIKYSTIATTHAAYVSSGVFNAYGLMDLKVVDNYGVEYKTTNIAKYVELIGITYSITNVKGGTVSLNAANGQITVGAGVQEFVLTAHAPNGKTVSTLVHNN